LSKNLQKKLILGVVSDTSIICKKGRFFAFEPVLRELEHLSTLFYSLYWVGYLKSNSKELNYRSSINDTIHFKCLEPSGGRGLLSKLKILIKLPNYVVKILSIIKKCDVVYSRGPSVPALITILFSFFFKNKIYIHKYAGGWDIKNVPYSYGFQRWILKNQKIGSVIVSANKNNLSHIKSFPNPCLNKDDFEIAQASIKTKIYGNRLNLCFVGRCEEAKGIIDTIKTLNILAEKNKLNQCIIAGHGDYNMLNAMLNKSAKERTKFIGVVSRSELNEVYLKSHFLLLPSKSEGFPKVVAEGANFGCIPIVSMLPGFDKILKDNINAILLEQYNDIYIAERILSIWKNNEIVQKMALEASKFSKQFSYESFNNNFLSLIQD